MSMEKKEIKDWGEKEMQDFLEEEGLEEWNELFEENKITGVDLQNLDRLEEIGIEKRGDRLTISNAVIKYLEKKSPSKVINDPIHGLMELHPLLIKIMDTPQFQRLRHIKQLGGAYFVYPGASHNRFEHSVGVAHLAGQLARALRSKQPELKIKDRDILCVQIAGLCHDLGHGPFSHLYDGIFIPKARPEEQWKHEDASLLMFDHLVEDNGLKPLMELYGLDPYGEKKNDLKFIKEMIQGKPLSNNEAEWPYEGRTEKKSFLYEIVANKLNGIDVDKFDYFARDAHHLGMQSNFDHKRFIKLARVCEVYDKKSKKPKKPKKHIKRICSRDKEVGNLYDMFHTRNCLHRRAYQHKTNNNIQIMISDAFLKADEHIEIEGSGGKRLKLSEAKNDMEAYTKLTDQVFERILHSSSEDPKEAREILERIVSRNLYMFVGEAKPMQEGQEGMREIPLRDIRNVKVTLAEALFLGENWADSFEVSPMPERREEILEILQQKIHDLKAALTEVENQPMQEGQEEMREILQQKIDDLKAALTKAENLASNFEVSIVTLDYGMKNKDPIKHTYFYSKYNPTKGFLIPENQKSKLLPTTFSEKIMRVYCKNPQNITLQQAREAFRNWCEDNDYEPVDGDRVVE